MGSIKKQSLPPYGLLSGQAEKWTHVNGIAVLLERQFRAA